MKEAEFVGDDLFVAAMMTSNVPILVDGVVVDSEPRHPSLPCKTGHGDPLLFEYLRYHHYDDPVQQASGIPSTYQPRMEPAAEVLKLWGWWFLSEFFNAVLGGQETSPEKENPKVVSSNTLGKFRTPDNLPGHPSSSMEDGDVLGAPVDRSYFADDPYFVEDSWLRRM